MSELALRRTVSWVSAAALVACSGSAERSTGGTQPSTPTTPTQPAPTPTPVIVVSADSVVAAAVAGASPLTSSFRISAGNATTLSNVSIGAPVYESGSGWLNVTASSTTDGATASVTVDPHSSIAGTYAATVSVSATDAKPVVVRVRFTVRARPVLTVAPGSIALVASTRDSAAEGVVALASSGDAIGGLTIGAPSCNGGVESRVSATLAGTTTPTTISLHANVKGLAITTYTCTIPLGTSQALVDSASRSITATLQIRPTPVMVLDRTALNLSAVVGDQGLGGSIAITNAGEGQLDGLTAGSIQYGDGASGWITGATLDHSVAPARLTVVVSAASLAAGTYSADIPVRSSAAGVINGAQTVHITLDVQDAGPPPPLIPNLPPPGGPPVLWISATTMFNACRYGQTITVGQVTVSMSDGSHRPIRPAPGSPYPVGLNAPTITASGGTTTPAVITVTAQCGNQSARGGAWVTYLNDLDQWVQVTVTVTVSP